MPYAIFRYDPEEEFALRPQVAMLQTRLEHAREAGHAHLARGVPGRRDAVGATTGGMVRGRAHHGSRTVVDTVHEVLADGVLPGATWSWSGIPENPDPLRDIVFILRTGALFPVYRTFSLLEQLNGRVVVPAVLFYPGDLEGPAGLKFMGVLQAEHNYRPRIF